MKETKWTVLACRNNAIDTAKFFKLRALNCFSVKKHLFTHKYYAQVQVLKCK